MKARIKYVKNEHIAIEGAVSRPFEPLLKDEFMSTDALIYYLHSY